MSNPSRSETLPAPDGTVAEIDVAAAPRRRELFMYICYICDMSDPVVESMADVRSHLADVIDRARREETPTIITRRGKQEAVVIDIQEYQRLREIAESVEEAWLNQMADEAESEGVEGAVSPEEMAALLRAHQG
jgi:prevent-host-death family protein